MEKKPKMSNDLHILYAGERYDGCVSARSHRLNCVNWARTHQRWLRQQGNRVIFSDESRFTIHRGDGRVRVCRRRNECYADCCLLERDRFVGGYSVLVWAGIAHGFRTNHVVIKGNSRIRKGEITFSFPVLPGKNFSFGEFADRAASSLLVKLDNGITQLMASGSKATGA